MTWLESSGFVFLLTWEKCFDNEITWSKRKKVNNRLRNIHCFAEDYFSENYFMKSNTKTNENSLFAKLEKFWEQYSNINFGLATCKHCEAATGDNNQSDKWIKVFMWDKMFPPAQICCAPDFTQSLTDFLGRLNNKNNKISKILNVRFLELVRLNSWQLIDN